MTEKLTFEDVVRSPDLLQGLKSVQSVSQEPVFCFQNDGLARAASEEARHRRPWILMLGHSREAARHHRSRVLELVKLTGPIMATDLAIEDTALKARFSHLPRTILAREVYTIEGFPHAKENLGFENLTFMHQGSQVEWNVAVTDKLWHALRGYRVTRREDLTPLLKAALARHTTT